MKLVFHYTYLIIALGFIITGHFPNLLIFTSIILIHELGHFIIAKLNNLNVEKIIIYPYGGMVKMNNLINTPIKKDLYVAIAGIIFQLIYFLIITIIYKQGLIREYLYNLYTIYNTSILTFNLLPIYPLDGSKIINLLLSKIFSYNQANQLTILISILTLIIVITINYYQFNYTTILIIGIIIDNLTKYYKQLKYLMNKFLLERYLYHFNYPKRKHIKNINHMYKDRTHIFEYNHQYLTEKQALSKKFKRKS